MNTTPVYFTGIDIGSTASKTVVLKEGKIEDYFVLPTGWNGRETANAILEQLWICQGVLTCVLMLTLLLIRSENLTQRWSESFSMQFHTAAA